MRKLRFIELSEDGHDIIVADPDGIQLVLPLDGAVTRAVTARLERLANASASALTPRQIQARIRAGESAEEVAHATGLPVEQVARFEGPVLEERAFQVRQALAGNTGPGGSRLGERVQAHFAALGLNQDSATWDSRRREDGTWLIELEYTFSGRIHGAQWIWERAARRVRPCDGLAHAISGVDAPQGDELTAVLSPIRSGRAGRLDAVAVTAADEPASTGAADADADEATALPARGPARRNRRPSVPVWADIVAGKRPPPTP